jgi:hypothetical protein
MSEYDRKFCGGCQTFKPLEGGAMKPTRVRPRWICKACATKDSDTTHKVSKNALPGV